MRKACSICCKSTCASGNESGSNPKFGLKRHLLGAAKVWLHNKRSSGGVEVQGHIALQRLTEGQHGLEILEIECDVSCVSRQVLVAQEHLVRINCKLCVQ